MASAVLQSPSSSLGWLSPRISFSRDFILNQESTTTTTTSNLDQDAEDFEFRLEDPAKKMLDADELFSGGKLVTLQPSQAAVTVSSNIRSNVENEDLKREENHQEIDEFLISKIFDEEISPKAPKCSSGRWKEFLGLKKIQHSSNKLQDLQKSASLPSSKSSKSSKFFLNRNSKSSSSFDSTSMNFPLLKDFDTELVSISSRLSLSSSSSSSHEHEDLPRLSLDSEKLSFNLFPLHRNPPRVKLTKQPKPTKLRSTTTTSRQNTSSRVGRTATRKAPDENGSRGVSMGDSPRMNSSGKIVFHSLERSSSSPSSFNGGPRMKTRGMERSYSANVRIRPVLNVPICTLRGSLSSKSGSGFGFGQFFSSQKRNGGTKNQVIKRNASESNR